MVLEYLPFPLGFCGVVGMGAGTWTLWAVHKQADRPYAFGDHAKDRQGGIKLVMGGAALSLLGWHIYSRSLSPAPTYAEDRQILAQQILDNCLPELTDLYYRILPTNSSLRALADVAKQSDQGMTCGNLVPFPSDGKWSINPQQEQSITWGFTAEDAHLFVAMPIKFGSDRGIFSMWQISSDPDVGKFEHNFYDYISPLRKGDTSKERFQEFQSLGRGRVVLCADRQGQPQNYYRDRGFSICPPILAPNQI